MSAYDDLLRAKATLSRHDGFRDSTGDYHPSLRESIHDELADALAGRWLSYGEDHQVDDLVEHPDRDGARITATHARLLAGALLPLVEARVQAAANQPVLCPKCNGQGAVAKPPWIPGDVHDWASAGVAPYVCNLCDGRMVIDRSALAQPAPGRAEE